MYASKKVTEMDVKSTTKMEHKETFREIIRELFPVWTAVGKVAAVGVLDSLYGPNDYPILRNYLLFSGLLDGTAGVMFVPVLNTAREDITGKKYEKGQIPYPYACTETTALRILKYGIDEVRMYVKKENKKR